MNTSQERGGEQVRDALWQEEDPGFREVRVQTPEEVARAFLREGGVVVPGPTEVRSQRRGWYLAVTVAVLVIAGAVTVAVLHPWRGTPRALATTGAVQHSSTTVVHRPKAPTTSTTVPPLANKAVLVTVLNASPINGLAAQTASALGQAGFTVSSVSNAPNKIAAGDPSEIHYGPEGLPAAHQLADSLNGPVTLVTDPTLAGTNVTLWVANSQLTVITTTTPTTVPSA